MTTLIPVSMLLVLAGLVSCYQMNPGKELPGLRTAPAQPRWGIGPASADERAKTTFPTVRVYGLPPYQFDPRETHRLTHRYVVLWPSGHFYAVCRDEPDSYPFNYDDWNMGWIGYYRIDKDHMLVESQLFCMSSGVYDGAYRREYLRMMPNDGLQYMHGDADILKRMPVRITLKPDW